MATTAPEVDASPVERPTPRLATRTPRWLVAAFVSLGLSVALLVAAWSVELPYLAYSPGPIGNAVGSIVIEEGTESFDPAGEMLVLTVSSQDLNAFEIVAAALDPGVDIYRREAVRSPDETDEEYRVRQLGLMDQSVQTAIAVANGVLQTQPSGFQILQIAGDYPSADVLEPGDRVMAVEGVEVTDAESISSLLADNQPGDVVAVQVRRGDDLLDLDVELGALEGEDRAVLGISVVPFFDNVDIETSNVGGPSAGLMYTLAIVDLLSEGDLTHGVVVAGTGTVRPDGTVGAIGGIRQKVVAAEAAGAEVLLVPADNMAVAETAERESIELISVATVDEALEALATLADR